MRVLIFCMPGSAIQTNSLSLQLFVIEAFFRWYVVASNRISGINKNQSQSPQPLKIRAVCFAIFLPTVVLLVGLFSRTQELALGFRYENEHVQFGPKQEILPRRFRSICTSKANAKNTCDSHDDYCVHHEAK
ncbi:hypothetical protein PRIPAC_77120, partial [Pristionchus pacificus]|uniref:Uncharacterized protein n=1 Tax=Pristionchus pacificus TaxID=54126 RepID=A0A2A6CPN4_PRIPA